MQPYQLELLFGNQFMAPLFALLFATCAVACAFAQGSAVLAPSGLSDCLWARAPNLTNRSAAAPARGVILMWLRTLDFDSE